LHFLSTAIVVLRLIANVFFFSERCDAGDLEAENIEKDEKTQSYILRFTLPSIYYKVLSTLLLLSKCSRDCSSLLAKEPP
jgi:hypothetical protein